MKIKIDNLSYKTMIWGCIFLFISEATVQIQYLILNRQVFNIMYIIYLFLAINIFVCIISVLKSNKIRYNKRVVNMFTTFIVTSITSIIINIFRMNFDLKYYFISYINLFMPFLLIFFIMINKYNVYNSSFNFNKYIFKVLTLLSIMFMAFGLLQYFKNDTIVPVVDSNGKELVHVYLTATKMRIFSLFQYPGTYGFIIAYMTTLWISKIKFIKGKYKRIKKMILFVLCLSGVFSVYNSGIRTNLIILALSILGVYLVKYVKNNKIIILISLIFASLMFVYYLNSYESGINNYTELNSNATLITRFNIWIKLLKQYTFNGDIINFLFGNSITSNASFGLNDPIDNFYVSMLLYNGVLGLSVWVIVNIYLFNLCLNKARVTKNIFWVAASSIYVALPTIFITSTLTMYPIVIIFAILQKEEKI